MGYGSAVTGSAIPNQSSGSDGSTSGVTHVCGANETMPQPIELASQELLKSQIGDALDKLTDRERKIIVLRFGLEDGRFRTLEEVGREFGVTRERIRQIEAKALRKLRHPSRSKKLRDYLE